MDWFSSILKRKMGAVFLSVAFVVLSAATAHATAAYLANINALLLYEADGFIFSGFEPGLGGGGDGNFAVTRERGNATAFATTDFDPLGILNPPLPTPIGTPGAITAFSVGGMLVSATAFGVADNLGFAASAAGSLGTLSFFNPNPFNTVDVNFTLLVNATIAGGSFGPTSIGNEEASFAAVALAGFASGFEQEDSGILKAGFDFAPPDFLHTTFETHDLGIVKKTFTRTLGKGSGGTVSLGVLAAGAAKATPEPGTIILLGTGLLGVGIWKLRKKKSEV